MFKCSNCGCEFDEPKTIVTTYESYYGAPIPTYSPLYLDVCPACESDEIEEVDEDEDYEQDEDADTVG